jgi:hypothetical protein
MKLKLFLATLLITNYSLVINAQFDDLYYDPNKDATTNVSVSDQQSNNSVLASPGFDDESYSYYDEIDDNDYYNSDYNDYQYSTRIRRFNRPSASIAYYSPIWGFGWRDPYYNPYFDNYNFGNNAVVVVVGNSWGWNRWNRWNSWNNCSFNNWGWNNNNCGFNNWGYNDWGWNNGWGNNYCVNNYYGYNNNHGNWNNGGWNNGGWNNGNNNGNNNNPHGTYYGSRKSGSSIASTKGRVEGPRKQTTNTNPEVRPDGLTKDNGDITSPDKSPRSERSRSNTNEIDKTADKSERTTIYNRKRGDVSDRSEKYKSDYAPAPKRNNNTQESDKTAERSSRREEKSSSTSSRSNESRSSQSSGRSYDGGSSSRSSGSSSSGSSSRSSSGSSSGGSRSSHRGGGK